jgi:hypothetical protein
MDSAPSREAIMRIGTHALLFVLATGLSAQAEEKAPAAGDAGRWGVNATLHGLIYGGDVSLGVTHHLTDHLALRPSLSFAHHTLDADEEHDFRRIPSYEAPPTPTLGPSTSASDHKTEGSAKGAALLWYFQEKEKQGLRPYLGVGYEHRASTTTETQRGEFPTYFWYYSSGQPQQATVITTHTFIERKERTHLGTLFLGAEHAFGRRCRAFTQVGIDYGSVKREERRTSTRTDPRDCYYQCYPIPEGSTETNTDASNGRGKIAGSFSGMLGLTFYLN